MTVPRASTQARVMTLRSVVLISSIACAACGGKSLSAGSNGNPEADADAGAVVDQSQPILSAECPTLLGSEADLAESNFTIIGMFAPLTGPKASLGAAMTQAVVMALREMRPTRDPAPWRPMAVLACDDQHDPAAAAKHLVDGLHVGVVIGPSDVIGMKTIAAILDSGGAATLLPMVNSSFAPRSLVWQMRGASPPKLDDQRQQAFEARLRTAFPQWGSATIPDDAVYTYESVYVIRYAFGSVHAPALPTGKDFATGMSRLVGPGDQVDLSDDFGEAFAAIHDGRILDVRGMSGPLDWDANGVPQP